MNRESLAGRTGRCNFNCVACSKWLFPPLMESGACPLEISVTEANRLLAQTGQVELIDVREPAERELCTIAGSTHIPMGQIPDQLTSLSRERHLLIHCHHGGRSMRVTQFLRAQGFARVSNVAGGIDAWAGQIDPTMKHY